MGRGDEAGCRIRGDRRPKWKFRLSQGGIGFWLLLSQLDYWPLSVFGRQVKGLMHETKRESADQPASPSATFTAIKDRHESANHRSYHPLQHRSGYGSYEHASPWADRRMDLDGWQQHEWGGWRVRDFRNAVCFKHSRSPGFCCEVDRRHRQFLAPWRRRRWRYLLQLRNSE